MERRGVLIEAGVVQNVIVWADNSEAQYEAEGWDVAMETTGLTVQPGIGWTWTEADGFRSPQPFPSWTWNGVGWEAPVPQPEGEYSWNEETQTWDAIPTEEPAP